MYRTYKRVNKWIIDFLYVLLDQACLENGDSKQLIKNASGDFGLRNSVLKSLNPKAISFLEERSTVRRLTQGQVLYEEGDMFVNAIFPHEGVVSMMARMHGGRSVEKLSIGNEGFVGIGCILGGGKTISTPVVQVEGYASWISIDDLDESYAKYPCVRAAMLRYAKRVIVQLMESVACNTHHEAEQRVSRWLLSAHDRVSSDSFELTQQALSDVLGLRRATISAASKALMDQGAIKYSRGNVTITDRDLLETKTCECYGRIRKAFEKNDPDEITATSFQIL